MAENFFDQTEIDVPGLTKKAAKKIGQGLASAADTVFGEPARVFQKAQARANPTATPAPASTPSLGDPSIGPPRPSQANGGLIPGDQAASQARAALSPGLDNEIRTQDTDSAFLADAQRKLDQRNGPRQADVFGAFDVQGNRIQSKANQRNQGAFGASGTTTGDSSGTGVNTSGAPNPVAQLASLRQTFGTPGGNANFTGNAIAQNSYARERNARLNDPRRQYLDRLNSQVRRGQISARAAGGIAANLLGQQGRLQLGQEKLVQDAASQANRTALERSKLGSAESIAAAKLKESSLQAGLDRTSAESIAQSKSATEAAKLGLSVDKFAETRRSNEADEALRSAKQKQQLGVAAAEYSQRERLAIMRDKTARQAQVEKLYSGMGEGKYTPEEFQDLLLQFAPDMFKE